MKKKNMVKLLGLLLIGANLLAPANVFAAEMPNADASGVQEVPEPPMTPEFEELIRQSHEYIDSQAEIDAKNREQGQAEWEAMYGKHDEPAQPTENAAPAESAPAPAPATNNVSQSAETTTSAPSTQISSNDASNVAESKVVKKQTKSDADAKDKETEKSTKEKITGDAVKKDSEKVSNDDNAAPAYKLDSTDPSSVVDDTEVPTDPRMDDSKKGGVVVAVFEKVGDTWKCIAAGVRDACSNAIDWFFGLWS
ncbi:MAG: hypothetical protein E7277_10085 [Lachnospiraceae bacterium]|nr:hypothetical protein [Lachnospiraceae bacterium]